MRRTALLPLVSFAMVVALLVTPVSAGTTYHYGFEDGDVTGWSSPSGSIVAVEEWSPEEDGWMGRVTFGDSCDGPRLDLGSHAPATMSFFLHPEDDASGGLGFFLHGSHDGDDFSDIVRISYYDGWLWWNNRTTHTALQPLTEVWEEWMQIQLVFDWESDELDIFVWGERFAIDVPFGEDADDVGRFAASGCGDGLTIGIDGITLTSVHQLSGTVFHNDTPLAGVEVFALTETGPRFTCTDPSGEYVFEDVGAVWILASGPSVTEAGCANPMFVLNPNAPKAGSLQPLMVAFAEQLGDGTELTEDTVIDLGAQQLPKAYRAVFRSLQESLWAAYHDDPPKLWENLLGLEEEIDELVNDHPSDDNGKGKGKRNLDPEDAEALRAYIHDLTGIGLEVAPLGEVLVRAPEGMPFELLSNDFLRFSFETGYAVHIEGSDDPTGFGPEDAPDVVFHDMPMFRSEPEMVLSIFQDLGYLGDLTPAYGEFLLDFATVDGHLLGIPISVAPKSLVWYPIEPFSGYDEPTTLEEFQALGALIASQRVEEWDPYPLCNYIGSDWATGWLATDWLEDLVLGKYGPDVYDQWISHEIPFNGLEITWAMDEYASMMDTPGWVYDREGMTSGHFSENAGVLVGGDCLMHRQAAFFAAFIPPEEWPNMATFHFPAATEEFSDALMGAGSYAAAVSDSDATRAFMAWLASADFGATIATDGGDLSWIMPHLGFDSGLYEDPFRGEWSDLAHTAIAAGQFRFDASDLMPWEVNVTFWDMMRAFADGQVTIEEALDRIELEWQRMTYFRVDPNRDYVDGYGWPDSYVTVEIGSFTEIVESGENGFRIDPPIDIEPGDVVRVIGSDSLIEKELVVQHLTLDVIDYDADVLAGTAASGTEVRVSGGYWIPGEEDYVFDEVATADGSGTWILDLSTLDEPFDLQPDMGPDAFIEDEDGDMTTASPPPFGRIYAYPQGDYLFGYDFLPGTSVQVEVFGEGDEPLITMSAEVYSPEWDPAVGVFDLSLEGFDLMPGHVVHATTEDLLLTKELEVLYLTIDFVDYEADTVGGTSPPDAEVRVGGGDEECGFEAYVTADGSGTWIAEIGALDWPCDLQPHMGLEAAVADDDGDETAAWPPEPPQEPMIRVSPFDDFIEGWHFESGTEVTVTVFDETTAEVFSETLVATIPDWDPSSTYFSTAVGEFVDIGPGWTVQAAAGDITKTLVVQHLTFDVLDPETDVLAGTAEPLATVYLNGGNEFDGFEAVAEADGSGTWIVDLQALDPPFDLQPDMGGEAFIPDLDNDQTVARPPEPPQEPMIRVSPVDDYIEGLGFEVDTEVTITITEGSSILLTTTAPVMEADWDPSQSYFWLGTGGIQDILPGHIVTVTSSDTTISRSLEIQELTYTTFDIVNDVVGGTAASGTEVFVHYDGGDEVSDIADGAGNWSIDLSGMTDLSFSTGSEAVIPDGDGDFTVAWPPPPPQFRLAAIEDHLDGWGFTADASVTIEVDTGSATHIESATLIDGEFHFDVAFNIEAGHTVTVTGDQSGAEKVLIVATLTMNPIDVDGDTLSGTADPGTWVRVNYGNEFEAYEAFVETDDFGSWLIDLSGQFNLTSESGAEAAIDDEDGDFTFAWSASP